MIQLNNVTKVYNGIPVLENFTAKIDKGEFVFICGPTGSGKSTLLKLIFCEEIPDSGQIIFQDEDISDINRSRIPYIRRSIGFIFQDSRLLLHKTVYDNISIVLRVTGFSWKDTENRVKETLRLVGMEDRIYAVSKELSGGEQQKVAISRAIVKDPLVLLADEPTGNLDSKSALGIFQILEKVNKTGTTIVIATHNYDIVNKMKKKVISLENAQRV